MTVTRKQAFTNKHRKRGKRLPRKVKPLPHRPLVPVVSSVEDSLVVPFVIDLTKYPENYYYFPKQGLFVVD